MYNLDININNTELFINRELSWLEFNERVLQEARDKNNPLFERFKFLSITSSNLDEFFMVRVGSIKEQVNSDINKKDYSGLSNKQQLKLISLRAHKMVNLQYTILNRVLIPNLKKNNINFLKKEELDENQKSFLLHYFHSTVFPVLTPMAVDASRPFPLIRNKSLNIGVILKDSEREDQTVFATVQVPSVLPRMVHLTTCDSSVENKSFIFLEEVITMFLKYLFNGQEIICAHPYRITRNADLEYDEDDAEDLLAEIKSSLKKRQWGVAIRLEVDSSMDSRMLDFLQTTLNIHEKDVYYIKGPLDLSFFMKLSSLEGYEELKYNCYKPQTPCNLLGYDDIFEAIKEKDIFLMHPYESFDPVIEFVNRASMDPNVLAIKQTLYRVSGDSPIVKMLAQAAENGKQVMVLVEVKARFDEENNILWAKKLEQAGCHVIYGIKGLKTHCKITLVVRRESDGIKRYVHMSTGNYNDITARMYTDMGLFTCNEHFGADASALFNMLSGYSDAPVWFKFEIAPLGMRGRFIELIENEKQNALQGKKAQIIAKMNSLVDPEIIIKLYEASCAGVRINLIVRGICSLRPGIKGISENITVISIVGRFLEHSRIYYFYNNGNKDIFLSSADWMPRNLNKRVELLFPVENSDIKKRIINTLNIELNNTVKARISDENGIYKSIDKRGKKIINSQDYFCRLAVEAAEQYNEINIVTSNGYDINISSKE
ncbi:MAG: RNA degradosome polyphosphate kinase [Sedimentibacter sp.]|uniref:RNA degradosome polyphosphate kinase n=1 Tax=Sedimentibacter sp. TaxID=1960295 RepID=UPI00298203DE|nr:RNA degradosome polyphosphate kinase [Sedimentibacter sp.]MDW5299189.1 RNA degradosome polyphosphate kinase [Sedimentibacter sp.]